ncbi:PHA/PHB synthase family protein [Gimibacter soli]|uniref:Class I poly(R)-hydroxyalkanoic acid synthase n=1 Tax=Gimibacter soli TaxID=3024400 RepID=A0AAE9XLH5_9PROT|nr:class I poly(R)-hydroxyalkanoic acid synthase [Gimibacter soli]WCL53112.1 class I poly(R)-hydroxyalkanoic acid synthase [Gimibacter soli]
MTDSEGTKGTGMPDMEAYAAFVSDAAGKSQQMIEEFLESQPTEVRSALDPMNLTPAILDLTRKMVADPNAFMRNQISFFEDYLKLVDASARRMAGMETMPVIEPTKGDKRFKAAGWSEQAPFDFIKQSYLLASRYIMQMVSNVHGLDPKEARKVEFFTKQMVDAASPSNFLLTNPEAIQATIESKGENLVRGMQHLLDDFQRNEGMPLVKMVDDSKFAVGENLATTPGKVVFRNRLFELIQYSPTTKDVYATPIVIFPPWINKFYILDLSAEKSFVSWAVAQGFTVFIVSWVNPDASYADCDIATYVNEGFLEAITVVQEITGEPSVHAVGYCVAGTILSMVLAYLHAEGREGIVKSATFFTAQVDFSEAGDLSVFIDDEQLALIDRMMTEKGYLDKRAMALTFNMLRSNDLIWSYVVNNYLMGREPMAFDLLYWNCDSTNLPRAFHKQYLNWMYKSNALVEPGAIEIMGQPIDLTSVETPCYIQAGREDHIAPPRSVFKITEQFQGPMRFVLAGSGHIAGVVNPPAANKYQYWTNDNRYKGFDAFLDGATETLGSWWPDWAAWLGTRSGKKVPAREPGKGPHKALEDAPGSYVKVKS